jgi:hypothetical protein
MMRHRRGYTFVSFADPLMTVLPLDRDVRAPPRPIVTNHQMQPIVHAAGMNLDASVPDASHDSMFEGDLDNRLKNQVRD